MTRSRLVLLGLLLFGLLVVGLTIPHADAWEVSLSPEKDWRSIYCVSMPNVGTQCRNTGSVHSDRKELLGNEHAEITDDAMWMISPEIGAVFGVHACTTEAKADLNCPLIVDLNASYMRRNVLAGSKVAGDNVDSPLEERRLPPLALWASLPDFQYTVTDWINKGVICPALPNGADRRDLCHEYKAWLGGGLNSTHFGTLAIKVYNHLHAVALAQAARAQKLRTDLAMGGAVGLPDGSTWHKEYIKEAEYLALAFETMGLHFVQDRWATGHMISRWGPGDYAQLPRGKRLNDAVQFGVLTGIVHGSQAVFEQPDPLNAPLLKNTPANKVFDYLHLDFDQHNSGTLATWKYTVDNPLSPPTQSQGGVGDLLFSSLMKRSYSGVEGARVDPAISLASATNQRKAMRYCVTQGFRQTVAALGQNGDDMFTFGAHEISLPPPDDAELEYEWVPGAERLGKNPGQDDLCTKMWVTNDAYYAGLRTIAGQRLIVGDIIVVVGAAISSDGKEYTPPMSVLARAGVAYTKARLKALRVVEFDKDFRERPDGTVDYGTNLARDGQTFKANGFWWKGNQNYRVPSYFEPVDLNLLPDLNNEYGKDKAAMWGLFNKAGAQHWCTGLVPRLQDLRAEVLTAAPADRDRVLATCAFLAERAYKGTDGDYPEDGPSEEHIGKFLPWAPSSEPKYGDTFEPICAYFDTGGMTDIRTSNDDDDTKPYYLHPGYVGTPGEKGSHGYSSQSIENWCAQIPVLDIPEATATSDTVYTINHTSSRWMTLQGRNLGSRTPTGAVGEVQMQDINGTWTSLDVWDEAPMMPMGGWSDDGEVLYARVPPSNRGFPTSATNTMLPHELLSLDPTPYRVKLVRPNDPTADIALHMANGAETVGEYVVQVLPTVLEVQWGPANAQTANFRGDFCYPNWLRGDIEVLAQGLYRKNIDGTYTSVAHPYTWHDDIPWSPNPNVNCDPHLERGGVEILQPNPMVFDGDVVFIFAYH